MSAFLVTGIGSAQDPPDLKLQNAKEEIITFHSPDGVDTPGYVQYSQPFQQSHLCGPNSVFLLLKLAGDKKVRYSEVVEHIKAPSVGASLQDLVSASEHFGLQCEARKGISPALLQEMPKPVVVHLSFSPSSQQVNRKGEEAPQDHFAVITGWDAERNSFFGLDTNNFRFTTFKAQTIARTMSGYCMIPKQMLSIQPGLMGRGMAVGTYVAAFLLVANAVAYLTLRRTKASP